MIVFKLSAVLLSCYCLPRILWVSLCHGLAPHANSVPHALVPIAFIHFASLLPDAFALPMQPTFHILSLRYISIAKLLISSTMALVMHPKPFICSAAAVHHHAQSMPAFPLRTWHQLRFSSVNGVAVAVQDLCLVLEVDA